MGTGNGKDEVSSGVSSTASGATTGENETSVKGSNVSGRAWKVDKGQFRVGSRQVKNKKLNSWEVKKQKMLEDKQFKQKLKELKEEKDQARKDKIQALKERREKKEEQERYAALATKMHAKKVDRLRRREKRNKALKER
ncbi:LAME_0F01002g1_1 [Lachancea meyersii CBS 8951]|uniref:rRNA-processing protein n=1 Tax=Lachancea meyersii CBS 8951 TaxID=1266667 RepID=A0A1G4JPL1_9SACH|nr:LAME_0F01002g1_1 [Lachancea meyersii CBS 8951]